MAVNAIARAANYAKDFQFQTAVFYGLVFLLLHTNLLFMENALKKGKKKANRLAWLPEEFRNDPMHYLKQFFEENDLQDIRTELWDWLYSALTSTAKEYNCNKKRGNLLWLCRQLCELVEANYLLNKKTQKKKKNNKQITQTATTGK